MIRKTDWSKNLTDFVNQTRNIPYAISANDCVHWCARAIEIMTDENLLEKNSTLFNYSDEQTMYAKLEQLGGLVRAVETVLEQQVRGGNNARRGDLVYFHPKPDVETLGICLGTQFVCVGDDGLEFVPMKFAEACWRLG